MLRWMRLPLNDAAGTNTNDTTEVEVGGAGSGIPVPDWAKSIAALHVHLVYLALTTKQSVAGYVRVQDDTNVLDPLNFPLPLVTVLTGAIGTHVVEDAVTIPCHHNVPVQNNKVHVYAGLDELSTGVHTIQAYVAFSSKPAPFDMKAEKSAVIAGSATANTKAGAATISTLTGKTAQIMGFWNYLYAYPTVDQTVGGYVTIESSIAGWQKQEMPTNTIPSGLSTQVTPLTKPVFMVVDELKKDLSGYTTLPYEGFNLNTGQAFNFNNFMDGTNTVAPAGRYGLIWREK